jgi:hypothetical protein
MPLVKLQAASGRASGSLRFVDPRARFAGFLDERGTAPVAGRSGDRLA